MKVCSDCHQHYIETTCPHCLNVPRRTTNMLGLILGVGLTACGVAESKYGVPMIDNDGDGKIDSDDDDEFGEPREYASKVAIQKISEDIINDIMTTW